ncbi:MAG: bile acid:sodium symporter, partial [Desulfocapsaceae bacterium]
MAFLISALFKQWFLISLALAACVGYQFPEFGQILIHYDILTIGLVLSFFLTGLFLETHVVFSDLNSVKGLTAAIISSLLVYPVVAWLFA